MWKYESPIGTLYIRFLPIQKSYGFFFNNICWETSHTPEAEADNIYLHCTGCYEWDSFDGSLFDVPSDLSGWEHC